jgi:hypothetical protein
LKKNVTKSSKARDTSYTINNKALRKWLMNSSTMEGSRYFAEISTQVSLYGEIIWYRIREDDPWWPSQIYNPNLLRGNILKEYLTETEQHPKLVIRLLNQSKNERYCFDKTTDIKLFADYSFVDQDMTIDQQRAFLIALKRANKLAEFNRNLKLIIYEHELNYVDLGPTTCRDKEEIAKECVSYYDRAKNNCKRIRKLPQFETDQRCRETSRVKEEEFNPNDNILVGETNSAIPTEKNKSYQTNLPPDTRSNIVIDLTGEESPECHLLDLGEEEVAMGVLISGHADMINSFHKYVEAKKRKYDGLSSEGNGVDNDCEVDLIKVIFVRRSEETRDITRS